jgi:hypothetical protein
MAWTSVGRELTTTYGRAPPIQYLVYIFVCCNVGHNNYAHTIMPRLKSFCGARYVTLFWAHPTPQTISVIGLDQELSYPINNYES